MHTDVVKRLQIYIDEDLNYALERLARAEKTSKAALIRRFVRDRRAAEAARGRLVDRRGFEPLTSALRTLRSPS